MPPRSHWVPFNILESGGSLANKNIPAEEFNLMELTLTRANWKSKKERRKILAAFHFRLSHHLCAVFNARVNSTIRFGVDDDGRVVGVYVEDRTLVL